MNEMTPEAKTTDLVSMLREAANGNYNPGEIFTIFATAADEIERLRDQLHACESSLSSYDEGANSEYWVRKQDGFYQRPRSLVDDANTVSRQRPSKSHDAGSNPAGDANIATWEEVDHFMAVCRRWLNEQESRRIDRLLASGKHEYVDCPKGVGCSDCLGWKEGT